MEVYFDDYIVFGLLKKHVGSLRLMLDTCKQHRISLNLKKFIFCAQFCILLGHVVCKHGVMVDPVNNVVIMNLPTSKIVIQLPQNWDTLATKKIL